MESSALQQIPALNCLVFKLLSENMSYIRIACSRGVKAKYILKVLKGYPVSGPLLWHVNGVIILNRQGVSRAKDFLLLQMIWSAVKRN